MIGEGGQRDRKRGRKRTKKVRCASLNHLFSRGYVVRVEGSARNDVTEREQLTGCKRAPLRAIPGSWDLGKGWELM